MQVKARNRMRIFKSVDEKLKEIGFNKTSEDKYGATYERYVAKYDYWQRVDIWHKASGRHILQSYDRDLMDEKKIGNTCIGLTGYEMNIANGRHSIHWQRMTRHITEWEKSIVINARFED